MKTQASKIASFWLVTILLVSGMASCSIDQRENETITKTEYFSIEPKSILESISQGKNDAFTSISDEPSLSSGSKNEQVNWQQEDYFRIAQALHELVWGESLETWNMYRMDFSTGCDQTNTGFQYAQFVYFKVAALDGRETRVGHFIEIDPSRNFIQAMETEYYPNVANWRTIDLRMLKVSASEALQIAEKDGGLEKRMTVKNECSISVGISRDTVAYDGWLVIYSPSVFIDKIDPVNGKSPS